ncbi:hypothetical protein BCR33DRAFT_720351 [Rhizoclosmatium globosum]|uniref:Uncharacterized protein n=1 Tax=Rhizoclosmatium globosum TaxID=329046 RepID=A0A1Y2BWH8_9FUNG|nr:hypothetical protein BCR33DRAFT_720351 [Rhizoclosmatium globosum]|eukprot:ORY39106.1 hypothetical protein BCR33DRAFT_720351 [Rhizoclosmatium globosum]
MHSNEGNPESRIPADVDAFLRDTAVLFDNTPLNASTIIHSDLNQSRVVDAMVHLETAFNAFQSTVVELHHSQPNIVRAIAESSGSALKSRQYTQHSSTGDSSHTIGTSTHRTGRFFCAATTATTITSSGVRPPSARELVLLERLAVIKAHRNRKRLQESHAAMMARMRVLLDLGM